MKPKTIVGNWKMHTTAAEARQLAGRVVDGVGNTDPVTVILCPPFPYLGLVGEILKDSRVALGAQNMYPEEEGAFTGEVSPTMLLDLGCKSSSSDTASGGTSWENPMHSSTRRFG